MKSLPHCSMRFAVRLFAVNPVEVRLEVAVGAGYVSDFNGEEDVAAVAGPAQVVFDGLVVRELARLGGAALVAAGSCGRGRPRHTLDRRIDFYVFEFFLALVDGVGDEG